MRLKVLQKLFGHKERQLPESPRGYSGLYTRHVGTLLHAAESALSCHIAHGSDTDGVYSGRGQPENINIYQYSSSLYRFEIS